MDHLAPVRDLLPGSRLDEVEVLSEGVRATVRRVRVRDDAGERTVIVKQFSGAGEEWVRECAALACLPPDAPAPRLLAESAQPQLAVLSDVGDGRRSRGIADLLLGADPQRAADAVVRWARALATLHACTRDVRARFEAQLALRAGDVPVPVSPWRGELASMVETVDRLCGSLGVATPSGTSQELHGLAGRVADGPSALSPHDTCPDNCVDVDGRLTLIDFEGAQWRAVAWDVAYLLVPWPTCWCCWRLPDDVARAAVDAYREIAAPAFPEVAGAGFDEQLQVAVVGWTLESAALLTDHALAGAEPHLGRWRPTPPRRAVLLHRLDVAARTTALPALAELCGRLAQELRGRWGADVVLPSAPAFGG